MAGWRRNEVKPDRTSTVVGIVLTVAAHVVVVVCGSFTGLKYIYPPPEEKSIVIEFEQENELNVPKIHGGVRPRVEEPDRTKAIQLAKASESPIKGTKANLASESTVGDDGDVEVNEPERKKEINKRALFFSAKNKTDKDTLAPQTSSEPSDRLSEGHASGNTRTETANMEVNAHLEGRTVINASLKKPGYTVQEEGIVVVRILVGQDGSVTMAETGVEGSTTQNPVLLNEARKAAMQTHFNIKPDAPVQQEGKITYIFKLK